MHLATALIVVAAAAPSKGVPVSWGTPHSPPVSALEWNMTVPEACVEIVVSWRSMFFTPGTKTWQCTPPRAVRVGWRSRKKGR